MKILLPVTSQSLHSILHVLVR